MKAVLKNGVIEPQEPVPADWPDGTELNIELREVSLHEQDLAEFDRCFAERDGLDSSVDPDDDSRLDAAIREIRRVAKAHARKEAGLPE